MISLLNSIQKGIKNVVDVFVLQGATIVDQVVTITPVENYVPTAERVIPFPTFCILFSSSATKTYILRCNSCRK